MPLFLLFQPAPGQSSSQALLVMAWYVVGFGAIFYFLFIRPQRQQQKKHAEMLASIKKGDEVVTAGGVVGEVVQIKENRLIIKSGESKLVVDKDRVVQVAGQRNETPAAT